MCLYKNHLYVYYRKDKGAKLDFKSEEVIKPSLELLKSKSSRVSHPIWANADIVLGPGTDDSPINHTV